ncbi:MAG TPA: DUF2723 domain-containing protein [Candidatus Ozemobacteraceae bacterium]|nr:DUF2723 domain-containing protein [Candidatus Ozemobacteraceae bacterium]
MTSRDALLKPGPLFATIAAFGILAATMAPGLAWRHFGDDGGELILASVFLGVAHPAGCPAYLFLGKLFSLLPGTATAWKFNLLSVCAGSLAVGAITALLGSLNTRYHWSLGPWSRTAIGLLIGLNPALWSQSVITEVYAPATAFALWGLVGVFSWAERRRHGGTGAGWLAAAAACFGLAAGIHLLTLFLLPGLLVLVMGADPGCWRRPSFWTALLIGTGLTVMLYASLPVLATRLAPVNWSYIRTPSDFLDHLTGQQYRYRMLALTGRESLERLSVKTLPYVRDGWGSIGLLLLALGLFRAWRAALTNPDGEYRERLMRDGAGWALLLLVPGYYIMQYSIDDWFPYTCLPFCLAGLLLPWGWLAVTDLAGRLVARKDRLRSAISLAIMIHAAVMIAANAPAMSMAGEREPDRWAQGVMAGVASESLIISDYDGRTNALMYHARLGPSPRPDVIVVLRSMLAKSWYRDHLRRIYPALVLPEPNAIELGMAWDDLCNAVARSILLKNADRPLYTVARRPEVTGSLALSQEYGIYRIMPEIYGGE